MNRLETRVKRLEVTGTGDDGDEPKLFVIKRVYLDQFGSEMKSEFLMSPAEPLLIPVPVEPELAYPDTILEPVLTTYRDEPVHMSGQQFKELMKVINGKSRTL